MPCPCWGPALRSGFPPSSADQAANDTGYRSWPVPFLGCASGPPGSLLIGASSRPGRLTGPRIKFTSNGNLNLNRNGNRNRNRNRNRKRR